MDIPYITEDMVKGGVIPVKMMLDGVWKHIGQATVVPDGIGLHLTMDLDTPEGKRVLGYLGQDYHISIDPLPVVVPNKEDNNRYGTESPYLF